MKDIIAEKLNMQPIDVDYSMPIGGSNSCKGVLNAFYGLNHTEEFKQRLSEERTDSGNPFYGMKHTEETKQKISESRKGKGTGPRDNTPYLVSNKGKNKGRLPHNATAILYKGKEYPSMKQACKDTGDTPHFVNKYGKRIATTK